MPNYDVMNKWEVNSTVLLTKTADRLLCKTRACQSIMRAWLEHNYPDLPNIGEHDVMFTSFSTPDPAARGGPATADFTQFLHLMGEASACSRKENKDVIMLSQLPITMRVPCGVGPISEPALAGGDFLC